MALSIGFNPGSIMDMYGNILTVNSLSSNYTDTTGINQDIARQS